MKRLEAWKALLGIAALLLAGGAAWASWEHGVAKLADVDQVRAGTAAQLGPVLVEQHALTVRTAVLERAVADLDEQLGKLSAQLATVHVQLVEIAKTVGARQVALPPPALPPQPP